jgi:hypothetical protein
MYDRRRRGLLFIAPLLTAICATAENLGGSYVAEEQASLTMTLLESSDGAVSRSRRPSADSDAKGASRPSAASSQRNVVINGQRLSDAELAQVEQAYHVHINDADYWYDPVLGAWGAKGGPAMGFIVPGLNLGGQLRPDASGGGSNTWQSGITGASGFSDGTTGAVFLPNGGIVSTGQ